LVTNEAFSCSETVVRPFICDLVSQPSSPRVQPGWAGF